MKASAMMRSTLSFGGFDPSVLGLWEKETPKERHGRLRTGNVNPSTTFGRFIFSSKFETFGGFVVFVNFLVMTMETNATAVQDDAVLQFVKQANRILLVWYCFECFSHLYLLRVRFFCSKWNILDLLVVLTGILSEIMLIASSGAKSNSLQQVTMLKSLRMLRLLRLLRLFVAFRELYVLIVGIGRCLKTLFWAFLLILMVLNIWSILSVEYLRTLAEDLGDKDSFGTCAWCQHAFSNIWLANLTWFQIISGDGWTDLGRPLVEEYHWPYLFFLSSIFVIVWGLLNIIVAAIVDANIAAREDDMASVAKIHKQQQTEAWANFEKLCVDMDTDDNGTISLSEFKNSFAESDELRQHLTTMGISEKDLEALLHVMDADRSGRLETSEFVEQFTLMKTLVTKTSLFYLMKYSEYHTSDLASIRSSMDNLLKEIRDIKFMKEAIPPPSTDGVAAPEIQDFLDIKVESDKIAPPSSGGVTVTQIKIPEFPENLHHVEAISNSCAMPHRPPQPAIPELGWYYYGIAPPDLSGGVKPFVHVSRVPSGQVSQMPVGTSMEHPVNVRTIRDFSREFGSNVTLDHSLSRTAICPSPRCSPRPAAPGFVEPGAQMPYCF